MQQPPFTALAAVYDAMMADVEYDHWADFVLTYARDGHLIPRTALDLACGTGNFTRELVAALGMGHVVGLDYSEEMLQVARQRLPGTEFVAGDLRTFELGRTFDLISCVFDSLNNLLTLPDLAASFEQIHRHLVPGGLLACDLNTRLGVRELWEGDQIEGLVTAADGSDVHYHWSHHYDAAQQLGIVQAFCRVQHGDDMREFIETHQERGYDPAEVAQVLRAAGFVRFEIVEYPDFADPTEETPRIWVFAWKEAGA